MGSKRENTKFGLSHALKVAWSGKSLISVSWEILTTFDPSVNPTASRPLVFADRKMLVRDWSLFTGREGRVPTQISFSNSLCFPCSTTNFPCANLRDL